MFFSSKMAITSVDMLNMHFPEGYLIQMSHEKKPPFHYTVMITKTGLILETSTFDFNGKKSKK